MAAQLTFQPAVARQSEASKLSRQRQVGLISCCFSCSKNFAIAWPYSAKLGSGVMMFDSQRPSHPSPNPNAMGICPLCTVGGVLQDMPISSRHKADPGSASIRKAQAPASATSSGRSSWMKCPGCGITSLASRQVRLLFRTGLCPLRSLLQSLRPA